MRLIMRGLTDAAFEQRFGTEDACLAALAAARQFERATHLALCRRASAPSLA